MKSLLFLGNIGTGEIILIALVLNIPTSLFVNV